MIFDTHAHYDDEASDEDRDVLLSALHADGICGIANVGYNRTSILRTHELAQRYPFVYEVLGFHPDEVGEMEEDAEHILDWLAVQLESPKTVAVGEIGLDYYWNKENHEVQERWFRAQLELARAKDLPVVIHSREAAADTLRILQEAALPAGTVDIHCYSYSPEHAEIYRKMGYYLGIGGVATFKNAKKLKEVIDLMPMDRILLETDAPYLAPVPFRGKRNDSGKICYVIDAIAQIKGRSPEEVEEICLGNAMRFYRLGEGGSAL